MFNLIFIFYFSKRTTGGDDWIKFRDEVTIIKPEPRYGRTWTIPANKWDHYNCESKIKSATWDEVVVEIIPQFWLFNEEKKLFFFPEKKIMFLKRLRI